MRRMLKWRSRMADEGKKRSRKGKNGGEACTETGVGKERGVGRR